MGSNSLYLLQRCWYGSSLQTATRDKEAVLLTGVIMGGGPSHWATESHLKAGLDVFATPEAARSFNDDLDEVREMGIQVVSEDEALQLTKKTTKIESCSILTTSVFEMH